MTSWWDAVRSWFRNGRKGGFPEPDREHPDNVQHFTGREDWISRRKNLTTSLGSREIAETMSAKIRAQAFFSARVAEGHILDRLREVSDAFTRGEIGQAEARTRLKQFLVSEGYDPQDGSLSNLASTARLNLILEQNARMGYAVGRWQEGMDPDIKERFPCWRYVGSTALSPRDSHARYAGHVYAKDDPIWHSIFPPSDFGCKCSVEDCDAPPEKAPKEITPPESGFAFDPAHAFERFDYDAIKDAELREKTRDGVGKILGAGSPTSPTKPAETHEEHLARRKEQWNAAYQKRLEAWDKQMESIHLKAEVREELLKLYTPEAAECGRPPKICPSTGSKTYLTKDGHNFIIGKDAKSVSDLLKRLKELPHKLKRGKQLSIARKNRTKREAKLIGAKMIRGRHTLEQDLAATNPNFGNGEEWENNCQRCVTAYEARRRGIDVEALPYIEKIDGTFSCMFLHGKLNPNGWTSAYQNPRPIYCGAKDGVTTGVKVARQLEEWGDGARGIVRVQLNDEDGGGGHVFIAENVNGEVRFIDPQNNDLDMSEYFSSVKNHETYVIRVDNLKFRDNVRKCCRKRGK